MGYHPTVAVGSTIDVDWRIRMGRSWMAIDRMRSLGKRSDLMSGRAYGGVANIGRDPLADDS
jgi:hypothetical protein